jgi:hexokinase
MKISSALIGFLASLVISGCACVDTLRCKVDEADVNACQKMLEAKYSGQALDSALSSLAQQYAEFRNDQQSCDKFTVFLKQHLGCLVE